MSEFVNTVEVMGDDALTDAIIQRTLSGSFNDDQVTKIRGNAFRWCESLTSVNFRAAVTCEGEAFAWCSKLATVDFSSIENLDGGAFGWCYALKTLIIRNTASVCTLSATMGSTIIHTGAGHIYVPSALVDAYKEATNWSTYASKIRALEDYTVDGTITGDLDETKI